jgi:hypothetical protein
VKEGVVTTRQETAAATVQRPLPRTQAWPAVARCAAVSGQLLAGGHVRLTKGWVGRRLSFADGTSALVYRETRLDGGTALDPCALVVAFRLRAVHGRGHALIRWENLLNTPLFVGSPTCLAFLSSPHGV